MARQQRSRDEQETTITYDSGEGLVRIYTSRPADIGRMRKAGIKPYDGNDFNGFRYKEPLNRLSWSIKPCPDGRTKRILAENHPFLRANRGRNATPAQA